ncbi:MAG: hypothetical protein WKG06_05215 [Segetibacter sp.]
MYKFTCPKGHKSFTQLQEQKFEILFDLGALALLDGYAKEAVSTIASSYERLVEYYIKVICLSKSISIDNFLKTWKTMSKQSERQIGAFYILQLLEQGETKFILNEKWVNFRNKVIHQGFIPKSEEAMDYGEHILSNVYAILKELNSKHEESIKKANFLRVSCEGEKIGTEVSISTGSMPTIISLRSINSANFGETTFREALNSIRTNGFYKHFYVKGTLRNLPFLKLLF